jgi:hypothetical protein
MQHRHELNFDQYHICQIKHLSIKLIYIQCGFKPSSILLQAEYEDSAIFLCCRANAVFALELT